MDPEKIELLLEVAHASSCVHFPQGVSVHRRNGSWYASFISKDNSTVFETPAMKSAAGAWNALVKAVRSAAEASHQSALRKFNDASDVINRLGTLGTLPVTGENNARERNPV